MNIGENFGLHLGMKFQTTFTNLDSMKKTCGEHQSYNIKSINSFNEINFIAQRASLYNDIQYIQ